jgi:plastocyanin domain-containing protein
MTAKFLVTLVGIALIVFINWYFFFSSGKKRPKRDI